MKNNKKTNEQLLGEISELNEKIVKLKKFKTKSEQSEKKLKESEEKFKLLSLSVEQSTEGIAHADLNGNLIYVNKARYEMHGYKSSKNLLGKDLEIFHNKRQLKNEVIPFNDEVKKNGTCSGEVGHITKEGKTFPTLMTSTLLKNIQGNPVTIIGIARDITDRKKAEEDYRTIIEQSNDMIWTLDKEGNFTFFNHRVVEITGYLLKDWKGRFLLIKLI